MLAVALSALLHSNSISASRIEVEPERVVLDLEVQTLSVLEVLPELDRGEDLILGAEERADGAEAIADYVRAHFVLREGGPDGPRLDLPLVELSESSPDVNLAFASQRLRLRFELEADHLPAGLHVEESLFETTSPGHRDYSTLSFSGHPDVEWIFSAESPVLEFTPDPERGAKLRRELALRGARGALSFELLGFVAVLALAARGPRAVLGAGAAWSLATAAAVLLEGALAAELPARLVGLAATLAVPYAATETALGRRPRDLSAEAALFGLVAGLAAGVELTPTLAEEPLAWTARTAYAAGGAATLLLASALAAALLRALPTAADRIARPCSAVLAAVGLWRFARAAWFPARPRT